MSQNENNAKAVRLSAMLVGHDRPAKMLYVLHGIFGSGRNWLSVIRRFVQTKPEWAARLIDLRQHGGSQGFAGPHTLETAANDLAELAAAHGETPSAILGHSFGGKVALMYARDHGENLEQVWVIDSTPEARAPEGSAWQMLKLIRSTPREFETRDQLIQRLTAAGTALPTAQWMATNLVQLDNGHYAWRFDLDAIEEMLRDFFKQDLWSVLENPPAHATIHVVKAKESSVLSSAAVKRVQSLERTMYHEVEGGHWVNAENPDALLALMTRYL